MRPRNVILGVGGLLALVGLVVLLQLFGESDAKSEGVAITPEAPEVIEREPEPLEDRAELVTPGSRIDRTQPEAPDESGSFDQLIANLQPATGFAVTGVVRFEGDGTPAAGLRFSLYNSGEDLFLETDELGRFATGHVLETGFTLFSHRVADEPGPLRRQLRFSPKSLTLEGAVGETKQIELTLLRAEAELDVLVVHRDGRPAPGALVQLQYRYEVRPGELHANTDIAFVMTDGIAGFALHDLEQVNAGKAAAVVASLEVRDPGGPERILISDLQHLEMPIPAGPMVEPLRLVLDESGSILIHVKDTEGAPVAGRGTFVLCDDPHLYLLNRRTAASDERGEILVRGLPPRSYTVRLVDSSPGSSGPEVAVHRGEVNEVELVLPAVRTQLAVSGTVVDEAGDPLEGVSIHVAYGPRVGPGDTSASAYTDQQGRFEFHAPPCDGLSVSSNRDLFGHQYDPVTLDLPFGATDVRFRRVLKVELAEVALEVVDAVSGERLDGVLLMAYRAPNLENYSFHRTNRGLASPFLADLPSTTIVFALSGYRRASASLEELGQSEAVGGLRRVALERGLRRRLHVEGDNAEGEGAPVVGARIQLGEKQLGLTDEAGELLVDLYEWPESGLTIEADGFTAATWLPSEGFADLEPAVVRLERE